jgi:3-isopropylmalate dehydratase small subunit
MKSNSLKAKKINFKPKQITMNNIENLNKEILVNQFNKLQIESFDELVNNVNYFSKKIDKIINPILEKKIDNVGLSTRAFNSLIWYMQEENLYDRSLSYIPKVKDAIKIDLEAFQIRRNVGHKTLLEIINLFDKIEH